MMDGWVAGAEVVEQRGGWGRIRYGARHKIAKVYATGNFVLEGDERRIQWRPDLGVATRRGGDRRSREYLVLITPKVEAEIEASQRVARARAAVVAEYERLEKVLRGNDDDALLAIAATLSNPHPNT